MNKEIEFYKNQKEKLLELSKLSEKNDKLEKSSNTLKRQLKKYQKRRWEVESQIKNDNIIIQKIKNYDKSINKEKKIRILKTFAYSMLVTSSTMLLKIATKNAFAGIPLHTTFLSFGMIEGMIYHNNTYDIKKLKKETNIEDINNRINIFENEYKELDEKVNSIIEIKNRKFDKIKENQNKIDTLNKELSNNKKLETNEEKLTKKR